MLQRGRFFLNHPDTGKEINPFIGNNEDSDVIKIIAEGAMPVLPVDYKISKQLFDACFIRNPHKRLSSNDIFDKFEGHLADVAVNNMEQTEAFWMEFGTSFSVVETTASGARPGLSLLRVECPEGYAVEEESDHDSNLPVVRVTSTATRTATFEQNLFHKLTHSGIQMPVHYYAKSLSWEKHHCFKNFASLITKMVITDTDFTMIYYPYFLIGAINLKELEFRYCGNVCLRSCYFKRTKISRITFTDTTISDDGLMNMVGFAEKKGVHMTFQLSENQPSFLKYNKLFFLLQHGVNFASLRIFLRKKYADPAERRRVEVKPGPDIFACIGLGKDISDMSINNWRVTDHGCGWDMWKVNPGGACFDCIIYFRHPCSEADISRAYGRVREQIPHTENYQTVSNAVIGNLFLSVFIDGVRTDL